MGKAKLITIIFFILLLTFLILTIIYLQEVSKYNKRTHLNNCIDSCIYNNVDTKLCDKICYEVINNETLEYTTFVDIENGDNGKVEAVSYAPSTNTIIIRETTNGSIIEERTDINYTLKKQNEYHPTQ